MEEDTPTTEAELPVPAFEPDIPKHLIADLSAKEQWFYERVSIQEQQNKWIIDRCVKADRKLKDLQRRVAGIETLKTILTAKWSIVALLLSAFVFPIALALVGAWGYAFFEKLLSVKTNL